MAWPDHQIAGLALSDINGLLLKFPSLANREIIRPSREAFRPNRDQVSRFSVLSGKHQGTAGRAETAVPFPVLAHRAGCVQPPRLAVSGSAANQDSVHRTARRRRSSSWPRLV